MCVYLKGFGPTFVMVFLGLTYLVLSLVIQRRLQSDPREEVEAKSLKFLSHGFGNTLRFIAFIIKGKINNPTTNFLRNVDRFLILALIVGVVLAIYADSMAPYCGFIS
jgi:hypothetical protein